jgi:bifunctional non-homologous end joining protein LigD
MNLKFGPYSVEISNEHKVFFPNDEISKGQLVNYYQKIASTMLPHIKEHPITMHRFPDGIDSDGFYQHKAGDYFPAWVQQVSLEKKENGSVNRVVCENAATLVYLAGQGCITPHMWLSRQDKPEYPDRLVFDLDPPKNDFKAVRFAAHALHDYLNNQLSLPVFVMTTGSRGLHVVVPLDRSADFNQVRSFAREVANGLAQYFPNELTTEIRKNKRNNRLFLDTARNTYGQTAVAPYGVRPKPGAPVATPLDWKELDYLELHAQRFTVKNIFRRLGQKKDPWKNMSRRAVSLKRAQHSLKKIKIKSE